MPGQSIYFYPMSAKGSKGKGNPYTRHLADVLSDHFRIVNRGDASSTGILNFVKYIPSTDILFLNWIEDLPDKRFGYLQTILFFLIIRYLRWKKKSIFWVLHNKFSHYRKNRWIKSKLFRLLATSSTHIMTHSREGLEYIKNYDKTRDHNIIFIHHPFIIREIQQQTKKPYDILIWGTLLEYKGVDKFLSYLHSTGLERKYNILVTGHIPSEPYRKTLYRFVTGNINIEDRFVDEKELFELISRSKIVLFTYRQESVLSSGALMDSLSAGAIVAGPDTGAFHDLSEEGLVITYSDFRDLLGKIDRILEGELSIDSEKLEYFIKGNSWEHLGIRLADFLNPFTDEHRHLTTV
jgi:beta-1,4-mannosyltransferase